MTRFFYYHFTMVYHLPQPNTKYYIYAVGEYDTASVSKTQNDDVYDYEFKPTKIIASNLMPKDWNQELNLSSSQIKNWTFDELDDAERFCIKEILNANLLS
jgi:hypothetical protein